MEFKQKFISFPRILQLLRIIIFLYYILNIL